MNEKIYLDIQMFAEGSAEGTSEGTVNASGLTGDFEQDFGRIFLGKTAPAKESAPVSQEETAEAEETSGTEDNQNEAEVGEDSAGDPDSEFEDLIKGKFKESFHKKTQGIINNRFKNAKETEGKLSLAMDALAPLFDRYGIEEANLEGIRDAIKSDAGIFAKKALEAGRESEEYRDAFNADRDRKQQAAKDERENRLKMAAEKYQDWKAQELEIQKTYPSFSLEKAFANEDFRNMAMSGTSLLNAYRASHFDEISAGLVAAATKRAAKNTLDSMQGNIRRPHEGGMSSAGGTVTKKDVSSLTGNDIDSILKAVGRGDKITF